MKKKLNEIFNEFSKLVDEVFSDDEKTEPKETKKAKNTLEGSRAWVRVGNSIFPVQGIYFTLYEGNQVGEWKIGVGSLSRSAIIDSYSTFKTKEAAEEYLNKLFTSLNA